MEQLSDASFARLDEIGDGIRDGLRAVFAEQARRWQVTGRGSLFRLHPHDRPIRSYRDSHSSDEEALTMDHLQKLLLEREVYLPGYGLGCMNLSTTDDDITHLVEAIADALPVLPHSDTD